jgi:hypothetical protein
MIQGERCNIDHAQYAARVLGFRIMNEYHATNISFHRKIALPLEETIIIIIVLVPIASIIKLGCCIEYLSAQ